MRTNAAELDDLRAEITKLKWGADAAAAQKETELSHARASHRAELMSARVRLDQLTGEAAALKESAGASAEEVKALLRKVEDLMDQNRALQQQVTLEQAKVA